MVVLWLGETVLLVEVDRVVVYVDLWIELVFHVVIEVDNLKVMIRFLDLEECDWIV